MSTRDIKKNDMSRLNFEQSINFLCDLQLADPNNLPKLPNKRPSYDEEEPWGVNFFRTALHATKLENLSLPRTYFGRSEIANCSFKNTNLSESTLCWNDFINVVFVNANLSDSDLRASIYDNVDFTQTDLSNSDLRHSSFSNCKFDKANLTGTKLTRISASKIHLSEEQKRNIDWQQDEGEEPSGG